jgi:hypothetical protein
LDTLDLEGALATADRIKANQERLEAARPPEVPGPVADATLTPPAHPEAPSGPAPRAAEPEEILERRMVVRATLAQLVALSRWMNDNGIDFEKIEGGIA